MAKRIAVGIDYSMSSPAICVHIGQSWSLSNCTFFCLTSKKKHTLKNKMFSVQFHKEFASQEERFDNISTWAITCIPTGATVTIENYAFAARGTVFDIGENCGLLKHKLYVNSIPFSVVSPPSVKKFASGKGNATKEDMFKAFSEETKFDMQKIFDCKIGDSPISDMIDAYFVAKIGFSTKNS